MQKIIDIEVFLVGAYSVFLFLVAFGLELVARYSHLRSKQLRVAGFRYHRQHDIWECPTGQHLRPLLQTMHGAWFDIERRRMPAMLAR